MSTFSERLMSMIGTRSKSEFARLCGVPESSVRQWIRGVSLPSAEKLAVIGEATGISIDWLVLGRGSKSATEISTEIHRTDDGETAPIERFLVSASAGFGRVVDTSPSDVIAFPRVILDSVEVRPDHARCLTASGTSMEPTIGNGDLLLVDVGATARSQVIEGRIYVLTVGDALFVKRLRRSPSGWVMVSDNRSLYPDEPIPAGVPVVIHGRVVWAGRKLG